MNNDKLLLLKALNQNVSTFSHLANEAKELSDGVIRICFDSVSKCVIFKWGSNIVRLNMQTLSITGLLYVNDFPLSSFNDLLARIVKFEDFDNRWTPILNDFFNKWQDYKQVIEDYNQFKIAFNLHLKLENDGVKFIKPILYFADVKIGGVAKILTKDTYILMTKEYYQIDIDRIYNDISEIKTDIETIEANIKDLNEEIETITGAVVISDTDIKINRNIVILWGTELKVFI